MNPTATDPRAHRRAILMMIAASVCWSSGGLLVRQLSITSAWEIVFWRSLAMAIFVAGTLVVLKGRGMPRAVRAVGAPGALSGIFLAGTFFFFIASLTRTTVANTFVLMSVSPFLAALAGRLLLRERVPPRTWVAMSVAFGGVVVMFADSVDAGQLAGNLLALGVSCCFALNVTMLRRFRATADMLPTVMLAGVFSLVPAFFLAGTLTATPRDLAVLALMGCVQLGTGCLLMTAASKHLSATELGLLALLEPILGRCGCGR
jgi:drug/metabolite transporter (DMT)-like permease